MIWENGIETHILSYVKQIASPVSMHDTGCSGLVHWDDPEKWDGEGDGRGFRFLLVNQPDVAVQASALVRPRAHIIGENCDC